MRTPLLPGLRSRLLVALLLIALTARSQQPRPGAASHPSAAARRSDAGREQLFVANARALPRLYEKKDFDSINYFIQVRWQPGPIDPDLLCQSILLSIQRQIFYLTDLPDLNSTWPMVGQLSVYTDVLAQIQRNCPPDYHARKGYDVADIDKQLYFTTARWAYDLLGTPGLDSVESFLCRVFTGEIRYPDEYLSIHTAPPTPNGVFTPSPGALPKLGAVLTIGTGVWAPAGHLSLLGLHPVLNYGLGLRTWHNEWDIDAAIRFVNSPSPYILLRNGSLLSQTFYEGGNLSLDYTGYLIHHIRWETGVTGGMGADFIDFTSSNQNPDWSPTEIACFDLNFGFRYNWYFSKHGFLGLIARYHFLSYTNPGGSPFDGNAATIDIIVGVTGHYRH